MLLRRERFDFEGIHANTSTWKADAALIYAVAAAGGGRIPLKVVVVAEGYVTIIGNMTAGFGNDGDPILGKVETYHSDNVMTVQDAGYTEMPGIFGSSSDRR